MKDDKPFLFRIEYIKPPYQDEPPDNTPDKPQTLPASTHFPKSVETQLPPKPASAFLRRSQLSNYFSSLTMDELRKIPLFIERNKPKPKNKQMVIDYIVHFFTTATLEEFDSWLTNFPPISQELIRDAALFGSVVLKKYEGKYDRSLLAEKGSYYSWYIKLSPSLNLDFFWTAKVINHVTAGLTDGMRSILKPWFVGPPESKLAGCAVDAPDPAQIYNNAIEISGSFPLLCDALLPLAAEAIKDAAKTTLKSLGRKQINTLQSLCGFKPFPEAGEKPVDALDIAARAALCLTNLKPARPENGQDGIKKLVDEFFYTDEDEPVNKSRLTYNWHFVEGYILTAHLRKKIIDWNYYQKPPVSRSIFKKLLEALAKDGGWFSVSSLARYLQINEPYFSFVNEHDEKRLYIRALSIVLDEITFKYEYDEGEFCPRLVLSYDLMIRPLLSAYCYLFAALGLLEITQSTPEQPVMSGSKKSRAFSPYDALDAVRVTNLGRWCLGLTDERPTHIQEDYEAIADKELLLVTVRGFSFERTLFLDSIGEKLGEDRWRISPRSFIADCASRQDIETRITKFKRLIDKTPAPHWEALFSRSLERAGLFNKNIVPATVYFLGDNRALIEELLADPALSGCAFRAEGRMLIVPEKYKRKFLDFLAAHGVVYT
ncbi:MAG: hypothetical protein LBG72_02005 [Spirochaetaceae bacterium]|jgi:hypothetical protein|nr:hypothetical protein [Spirochaetaceae bacterium]